MFDFLRKQAPGANGGTNRQRYRTRPPITIGFEELEGRDMLSAGVALTIIPTETRPLIRMPRPYFGSIDPESRPVVTIPRRVEPEVSGPDRPARLWPLGGRFRMG